MYCCWFEMRAEVAAVADAVAGAQELERLDALDVAGAGRPVDAGVGVLDAAVADAHVDAADRRWSSR